MHRLAVALAAAAAVGVATASGAPPATGLRGVVSRGPTQPVCRVDEPCSTPAGNVLLVFRRRGGATRTRTDANGRYHVALAPGTWQLSTGATTIGRGVEPRTVLVPARGYRVVDLFIDTGIR